MADNRGRIVESPGLAAAGRSGHAVVPLESGDLIPLPANSRLFLLPGRLAVGFDAEGRPASIAGSSAVAAFLPPGYVALCLAAFERERNAAALPLFTYGAVCWHRDRFHAPALRVDSDPKHDPSQFDPRAVAREVRRRLREQPGNRLLKHHGEVCALEYGCPNAANLFLGRWEAPVAVSGGCNAACRGCISEQEDGGIPSPQARIPFTPTVGEIVELAVPHLERAPRAMVSFGQGCEGEPLLKGRLIETAIRAIRRRTPRGRLHLNTNGSLPRVLGRLIDAGLNSVRVSLNSAQPSLYSAYYRCRRYAFQDVRESLRIARQGGLWVSLNYLTFPGVTDRADEAGALSRLLASARPDMIQWRNLNIDPDAYMALVDRALPPRRGAGLGVREAIRKVEERFPGVRMGYFNPPG